MGEENHLWLGALFKDTSVINGNRIHTLMPSGYVYGNRPLHTTSQAQTASSLGSKGYLSLAESWPWRVHVYTFPLFDLGDGGICKGSIRSTLEVRNF